MHGSHSFWSLVLLGLVGCQAVFGDFEASSEADDAGTGGAAGSGAGGSPVCAPDGEYRCTGTELELCDASSTDGWIPVAACALPELCDATSGMCDLCRADSAQCDAWILELCNPEGTQWVPSVECQSEAYCDSETRRCNVCLPTEAFCNGATLYTCAPDQASWTALFCESEDLCNVASRTCRACVAGEVQCDGTTISVCDADQTWTPVADCLTSALCAESVASSIVTGTVACVPPVCEVGDFQCDPQNPAQLMGCPPSRDAWNAISTCLTPALCNAELGRCDTGCMPGEYRCDGASLELCSQDGTGYVRQKLCASADLCNVSERDCVACTTGDTQCNEATLERCDENQTWVSDAVCASAALCDEVGGRCVEPTCVQAGATSCDGANLLVCASDLTAYEPLDVCASSALCNAVDGRCDMPACVTPGEVRCAGNVREQCRVDLTGWDELDICTAEQLCDLDQGCVTECPTPDFRCNGPVVESCQVIDGVPVWVAETVCATSALCETTETGASCAEVTCEVDEYRCNGDDLERCALGRDGWELIAACGPDESCDQAGEQCDVCQAGAFACEGEELLRCAADGSTESVVEICASAADCIVSSDAMSGSCAVCASGASQCVGAEEIRDCAADGSAWETMRACEFGCEDLAGDSDYCAGCPSAGASECVTEEPPGSVRRCPEGRAAWGDVVECSAGFGCVDSGTSDFCAECVLDDDCSGTAGCVGGRCEGSGGNTGQGGGGGSTAEGGAAGQGGAPSEGGVPNEGGAPSEGGAAGQGGVPSEGGVPNEGGAPSEGGVSGEGGATVEGGAPSEGGATVEGGAPSEGGATVEGGASSEGGATVDGVVQPRLPAVGWARELRS